METPITQSDREWERERDRGHVRERENGVANGRENGFANGREDGRDREREREPEREPESSPHQVLQGPSRVNREVYPENGRYYGTFRRGKYMFPVDEAEMDKLDILHKFFVMVRGGRHFTSPLSTSEPRIMDLGCGTGIWAIDVAEQYPSGFHLGVDLNLIQPEFIPPNVQFAQEDIEVPWVDMAPGTWDLIHMRTLHGSISNWPRLYSEIFRHLKPRVGRLEQVEIDWMPRSDDGTLPPTSALRQWGSELLSAMDGFDRPLRVNVELTRRRLADAGFVDIREETIPFAINGWPSETPKQSIGRWFNLAFVQGLEGLTLAPLFRGQNTSPVDIRALIERVNRECRMTKMHTYMTLHVFTALRP